MTARIRERVQCLGHVCPVRRPDWMRRGIVQDLVVDAVAIARAAGLDRIEVTGSDHARKFYAQAGFVQIGVVDTPLGVPAARLRRTIAD